MAAAVSLKVMTFNLRRRKESDGENMWDHRREAAAEVVRRQAPDILGTQEGLPEQVGYLRQHFPEYGMLGEARHGGSKDEYNAIFYRKDRFKVAAQGNFWLSDTPEKAGSRSWGNLVPRMATWARFIDKDSGQAFVHLNTHLDHLVPGARKKGATLISQRMPKDVPVIMTGDFNSLQQGGTYRYLTGAVGLLDSRWASRTPVSTKWNATFHRFTGRGLYRIDYILGRGVLEFSDYAVVRDRVAGKLPSDHFPVVSHATLMPVERSVRIPVSEPALVRA
ncbi:MAG TPA: endonuclease/exonuclease/phosphatase family protein [Candidatus Thermoplasmatota archaeon]|nr:endonuclease/exonuclease/phosphatase family protein [Candidatus Thermoplasmatota archaeon]